MEMKELLQFIELKDARVKKYWGCEDIHKHVLARTVKLNEETGELAKEILRQTSYLRKPQLEILPNTPEECADVIITALLIARALDIDIEKALACKIEKINKRYVDGDYHK